MADDSTPTCLRLVWLTDPHLNFLRHPTAARMFGEYLREETRGEVFLATGDISEAPGLDHHLRELLKGLERPLYFVLGNHDYYKGSFAKSQQVASAFATWLDHGEVHKLTENVALVGSEGWYDALYGDPMTSRFGMTDWRDIEDLEQLPGSPFGVRSMYHRPDGKVVRDVVLDREARQRVIDVCRERSREFANSAKERLTKALTSFKRVIFATHVPPFEGATWHEGKVSDKMWIPWFSSKLMGEALLEVADAHPDRKILVLCGHTHSSGLYSPRENLQVLTGEAVYGSPDVAGILEIPENDTPIKIDVKLNKKWTRLSF